ncbi:hypothetical protein [Ruegeria arenilitoris]|uniref:hypothetical protein n=1 Tax=Ruegeria arenilitoris TaxID=1173585 RepID=UPI00147E0B78|nr:hypothetical protein [Ruegeria arenilitoris]
MKDGRYQIFNDGDDVVVKDENETKKILAAKSDFKLRVETTKAKLQPNHGAILEAAALSQMELDRRAAEQQEKIAQRTTYWSACVAIVSVIIGAVLGALLS